MALNPQRPLALRALRVAASVDLVVQRRRQQAVVVYLVIRRRPLRAQDYLVLNNNQRQLVAYLAGRQHLRPTNPYLVLDKRPRPPQRQQITHRLTLVVVRRQRIRRVLYLAARVVVNRRCLWPNRLVVRRLVLVEQIQVSIVDLIQFDLTLN